MIKSLDRKWRYPSKKNKKYMTPSQKQAKKCAHAPEFGRLGLDFFR